MMWSVFASLRTLSTLVVALLLLSPAKPAFSQAFADSFWEYQISGNFGEFRLNSGMVEFSCLAGSKQVTVVVNAGGLPRQTTIEIRNGGNFYRSTARLNTRGTYQFTVAPAKISNLFRLFTRFADLSISVEAAGPLSVRTGAGGGSDVADVMTSFCMNGGTSGGGGLGGGSGPAVIIPGPGGGQAGATPGAGGGQSGSVSLLDVLNIIGQLNDAKTDAEPERKPEPEPAPEAVGPPVLNPDPANPGVVALPCSAEPYARANTNTGRVNFALVNESGSVREVYWIDFEGQRQFDRELRAGQVVNLLTNPNAPWLVTNTAGVCTDLLLVFSDGIYSLR